jgi:multiple inositol-polyphosphate phosphatase / 2,3-bisphosphoglycerate 3-phosphatase
VLLIYFSVSKTSKQKLVDNTNHFYTKWNSMIIDAAMLHSQARHGTRSPTKKRIRELDNLAAQLEDLVRDAKERKLSLERVPSWLNGWKSPWHGRLKGGELIRLGEEELFELGIRIRERFPSLFDEDYHPDIYPIKATQVSLSSFFPSR